MVSNNNLSNDLSGYTLTAFESLFNTHYKGLCFIAFKIVKSWPAAEDIVQDFFIKCWQNRESINIQTSFSAYAARSIHNRSINELQKEGVRQKHESRMTSEFAEQDDYDPILQQNDERYINLFKAIEKLPAQRKKVFLMVHYEKLKYREVAEKLNISPNTVKTHIKMAYSSLRENLMVLLLFILVFFENL